MIASVSGFWVVPKRKNNAKPKKAIAIFCADESKPESGYVMVATDSGEPAFLKMSEIIIKQ